MARLLFILAEWPRRYVPLMPNQVVDVLLHAMPDITSCLTNEPNSNDREYSQLFRHFQSDRIASLPPIATLRNVGLTLLCSSALH
jgi:hypothetical protein